MGTSEDAAAIQREMARVRSSLHGDVAGLVENARVMTDWRHYVRQYPWACLGGAALVGYMLIPRRVEIVSPDADTLAKLAARNQLVVQQKAKAEPKSSLATTAMTMVTHMVMRAVLAYASQQAGKLMGHGVSQMTDSDPGAAYGFPHSAKPQAGPYSHAEHEG